LLLEVRRLKVEADGRRVIEDVNLSIEEGETHVLLGPNGSGKTSLLMTLMGSPKYRVTDGQIFFKGEEITNLSTTERVKMGMGIAFQHPPVLRGIKLADMLNICMKREGKPTPDQIKLAENLNLVDFLGREVNYGFSGGEAKRSEVLQVIAQQPTFVMLDEPDSGVDVHNMELVGRALSSLLRGDDLPSTRKRAGLIVTHQGYILRYVKADRGHVMLNGKIVCHGDPTELLLDITKLGYEGCVKSCLGKIVF
jgi:Fe-S cluster assembly ATP-binding protein